MRVVDLRKLRSPHEMSHAQRSMLFPIMLPLSVVYGGAIRLWRKLPVQPVNVGIPVLSIGSILVGGTGKTPLCMLMAKGLAGWGRRVCIISRGYMRRSRHSPLQVSDGGRLMATVAEAGDEPYLMAKRLPGVCVVVAKDRVAAASVASGAFRPDVFLLDDGFQSRRIFKDVDVVTVDASSLRTRQAMLPLGRLREDWARIRPQHICVVLLEPGEPTPEATLLERLPTKTVFYATYEEAVVLDAGGNRIGIETVRRDKVLILSGIASPARFENTCSLAGIEAAASVRTDDHHWYTDRDARKILDLMEHHGCKRVITTEKDFYKLPAELRDVAWVVRADLKIGDPQAFWDEIKRRMRGPV